MTVRAFEYLEPTIHTVAPVRTQITLHTENTDPIRDFKVCHLVMREGLWWEETRSVEEPHEKTNGGGQETCSNPGFPPPPSPSLSLKQW